MICMCEKNGHIIIMMCHVVHMCVYVQQGVHISNNNNLYSAKYEGGMSIYIYTQSKHLLNIWRF